MHQLSPRAIPASTLNGDSSLTTRTVFVDCPLDGKHLAQEQIGVRVGFEQDLVELHEMVWRLVSLLGCCFALDIMERCQQQC